MTKPSIGFIGTGIMGAPMAGHLAGVDYALTLYDLDPDKAAAMAVRYPEISIVESPAAVGERADNVVTMPPSSAYVR
jgi:3-hydroxyisobutyrate dehydrogenase